jgi:hypothetical protein
MSSVQEPHLHLEVGHILFLDIVVYSKLLADEENELVQELNQIAFSSRPSARFAIIAVDFHAHLTWEFFRKLND